MKDIEEIQLGEDGSVEVEVDVVLAESASALTQGYRGLAPEGPVGAGRWPR